MNITYDSDGRIEIQDGRFAHFLPALLGGPIFRAAGSALKWLGKKAVKGVSSLIGRGQAETPIEEEASFAETGPEEEDVGEAFDVYYDESSNTFTLHSDELSNLSEDVSDALTGHIHGYLNDELEEGIVLHDEEECAYDAYAPIPEFAHFKKLKKKFKKLAKSVGKIAGRLGPLASLIPGGQVLSLASAVGGMASKRGRQRAAQTGAQALGLSGADLMSRLPPELAAQVGQYAAMDEVLSESAANRDALRVDASLPTVLDGSVR